MQIFTRPNDYDKSAVDYRRDHIVMGPGDGRDLVYQDGKFFTSFGRQINPTPEELKKNGIPFTTDMKNFLSRVVLLKKEEKLKKILQEKLKEIEDRERRKISEGLAGGSVTALTTEEPDAEEQVGALDLTGIDELLAEQEDELDAEEGLNDTHDVSAAPPKAKSKPKPTSTRRK